MAHDIASSAGIWVGGLPSHFDVQQLRKVFNAYGDITSCKILGSNPNEKNAALIRFSSAEEASWMVENLNTNIPQGLSEPITVRFATSGFGSLSGKGGPSSRSGPYDSRAAACSEDHRGGWLRGTNFPMKVLYDGLLQAQVLPGGDRYNQHTLYVAGLPSDCSDLDLYKVFAGFGAIPHKGVHTMLHEDGTCTGIGFVSYLKRTDAQHAIDTLHGTLMPDGKSLTVSFKRQKES